MDNKSVIEKTAEFVRKTFAGAEGGHDWWHAYRVANTAKHIAGLEGGVDIFIVELAALLHDIADSKFHGGDEKAGVRKAGKFLSSLNVDSEVIDHIEKIIENISFRKSEDKQIFTSPELKVVQDADRLDAMGAIGIARAFNYGGFKNREIYNPDIKPDTNMTKEQYKKNNSPTINHFYEKLLLLKDIMNTATGKKMAEERHRFMELFLEQFYSEWARE